MRFPIIKHARAWVLTSFVIMATGIYVFLNFMRVSIQFTGGMEIVTKAPTISQETVAAVKEALQNKGVTQATITAGQKDAYGSLLVQIAFSGDEQIELVTSTIEEVLTQQQTITSKDDILELSVIGPSIGEYMKKSAKYAIIAGIVLMAIYILFSFSEMRAFVSPALL